MATQERWPDEIRAWWEGLPDGEASHPGCRVKAAVWRELARGLPRPETLLEELPPATRALVEAPPPPSAWVPEVHVNLAACLAADRLFDDWESFYDYTYAMNRRLLSGPMYRILLKLLSPERVVKGSSLAYGQMHRGSEATARRVESGVELTLRYPEGLFPPGFLRAFPTSIRAALELSNATDVEVTIGEERPDRTVYAARWG